MNFKGPTTFIYIHYIGKTVPLSKQPHPTLLYAMVRYQAHQGLRKSWENLV